MTIQTDIDYELDELAAGGLDSADPEVQIKQVRLNGTPVLNRRRWVIWGVSALSFISVALYLLIRPTKSAADAANEKAVAVVSVKVAKAEKREIALIVPSRYGSRLLTMRVDCAQMDPSV